MLTNIPLETAWDLISTIKPPQATEKIPLLEARGRITAAALTAAGNFPPSPRAAMDGYALRSDDLSPRDHYLLTAAYGQGAADTAPLEPGQTARVVTGGPLPPGDVTVIPWEKVKLDGDKLTFTAAISPGSNVRPAGEDFAAGDLLAPAGTQLDPGHIGALAAFGCATVEVLRPPRVAVITLGPEVAAFDAVPAPGQARDSNGPILAALIEQDGGHVVSLQTTTAADLEHLPRRLTQLLADADLLLTIGGTAAGAGDNTQHLLQQMNAEILFWGVRIKPGSHTGAARWENKPIFTLSGNPAACAVGYHLLAAPILRALQARPLLPPRLQAAFNGTFTKKSGTRRFLRGRVQCSAQGWAVTPQPGQKSSMMRSLMGCNALIDLPAGHPPLAQGDRVEVIPVAPPDDPRF